MGVLVGLNFSFSMFLVLNDGDNFYEQSQYFVAIFSSATTLNMIFTADLVLNLVFLGPINVWKEKKYLCVEMLLQLLALVQGSSP